MDNLTHTLCGALIGLRYANGKRSAARAIVTASILANNLPDIDVVYAPFVSAPFGSLLHHRGHTHTFLVAIALGCLFALVTLAVFSAVGRSVPKEHRWHVVLVAMIGAITHILCDWMNSYGVHPFWPFSNEWHYGDTLFIIEPTLWIALSMSVCAMIKTRLLRGICFLPTLLAFTLMVILGRVPPEMTVLLVLVTVGMFVVLRSSSAATRSNAWIAICVCALVTFGVMHRVASTAAASQRQPGDVVLNEAVVPSPANPFCWTQLSIILREGQPIARTVTVEPFREIYTFRCPRYSVRGALSGAVGDVHEALLSRASLERYAGQCRWNAFRQFARFPYVAACENGGHCSADLRFSSFGRSFASIPLDGDCPDHLPPWEPVMQYPWEAPRVVHGLELGR